MRKRIPLYDGWLYILHDKDAWDRTFRRLCRLSGSEADEQSMTGHLPRDGCVSSVAIDGVLHIVAGVFDRGPDRDLVACHEGTHCAQELAEHTGINPIKEKEGFAYLSTYFYQELKK